MKIHLTITVQSPVAVGGRKPAGQFQRSLEYIPGAVLRGGLAQTMIRAGLLNSRLFARLFTAEQPAVFSNAYPQHWESGFGETRVVPMTAMSCKTHPGFQTGDRDRHGVFDTLIDRLCWEQLRPAGLLYSPNCPRAGCGGLVDRFEGFYSTSYEDYRQPEVQQRLLTRVALNRRRGVAEDQLLYSPSVLSEALRRVEDGELTYHPSVFVADIKVDLTSDETAEVKKLLEAIRYLGGGGSRGLGPGWALSTQRQEGDGDSTNS
jgi:CRISPR-associated protein Csx10